MVEGVDFVFVAFCCVFVGSFRLQPEREKQLREGTSHDL